jgi:hypothetical protein
MTARSILSVTGNDRIDFLQGLITNTVPASNDIAYAALLTPQGKFIADFFVITQEARILLDVAEPHAQSLLQRLSMYRLRANVAIEPIAMPVSRGLGAVPAGGYADPRHPDLGWRCYDGDALDGDVDWDALRIAHIIPETGIELTPDSYILEAGFERLNGIDFKKGCYVGQEIVARMKHKTTLKKGLRRVVVTGPAEAGTVITSAGKPAGVLHTRSGDQAIAYLRFDRTTDMQAGAAVLRLSD